MKQLILRISSCLGFVKRRSVQGSLYQEGELNSIWRRGEKNVFKRDFSMTINFQVVFFNKKFPLFHSTPKCRSKNNIAWVRTLQFCLPASSGNGPKSIINLTDVVALTWLCNLYIKVILEMAQLLVAHFESQQSF